MIKISHVKVWKSLFEPNSLFPATSPTPNHPRAKTLRQLLTSDAAFLLRFSQLKKVIPGNQFFRRQQDAGGTEGGFLGI